MGANKWLLKEDGLLISGPTAELSFTRAGPRMLNGEQRPPSAREELRSKLGEIQALRSMLRSRGASPAEIAVQTAPLLKEIQTLKQKVGPAKFDDVVPIPMPTRALV